MDCISFILWSLKRIYWSFSIWNYVRQTEKKKTQKKISDHIPVKTLNSFNLNRSDIPKNLLSVNWGLIQQFKNRIAVLTETLVSYTRFLPFFDWSAHHRKLSHRWVFFWRCKVCLHYLSFLMFKESSNETNNKKSNANML